MWLVAEHPDYRTESWLIPRQGSIDHHFVLQKKASLKIQEEKGSYGMDYISPDFSSHSFGFQNEPDGFRGINWGTNITNLPNMIVKEREGDQKFCWRKRDRMKIGDADVKEIVYCFYKDKLEGVMIKFSSYLDFYKLKETLFQVYGTGHRPNQFLEDYLWVGKNVGIVLKYNEIIENGIIYYTFEPIARQRQIDQKQKAKEAVKDL